LFWTSCYLRIIRDGLVIGNRWNSPQQVM
jgi:hypothetical protein